MSGNNPLQSTRPGTPWGTYPGSSLTSPSQGNIGYITGQLLRECYYLVGGAYNALPSVSDVWKRVNNAFTFPSAAAHELNSDNSKQVQDLSKLLDSGEKIDAGIKISEGNVVSWEQLLNDKKKYGELIEDRRTKIDGRKKLGEDYSKLELELGAYLKKLIIINDIMLNHLNRLNIDRDGLEILKGEYNKIINEMRTISKEHERLGKEQESLQLLSDEIVEKISTLSSGQQQKVESPELEKLLKKYVEIFNNKTPISKEYNHLEKQLKSLEQKSYDIGKEINALLHPPKVGGIKV